MPQLRRLSHSQRCCQSFVVWAICTTCHLNLSYKTNAGPTLEYNREQDKLHSVTPGLVRVRNRGWAHISQASVQHTTSGRYLFVPL